MFNKKLHVLCALAVAGTMVVSGCGSKQGREDAGDSVSNVITDEEENSNDTPKPVKPKESESSIPAKETEDLGALAETETETGTEAQTEKQLSLSDIMQEYKYRPSEGSVAISVTQGGEQKEWTGRYLEDEETLCLLDPDKKELLYLGEPTYMNSSGWTLLNAAYEKIMDLGSQKACEYVGEGKVNGEKCREIDTQKVSNLFDENIAVILQAAGFEKVKSAESRCQYFLDGGGKMKVLSITCDAPDSSFKILFVPDKESGSAITVPEEVILEATSGYIPGEISEETNSYVNPFFFLKLTGDDTLSLDPGKTISIEEENKTGKRRYKEEAFGTCDGGIVNIASVYTGPDISKEEILSGYLDDCLAQMKGSVEEAQIAGRNACRMSALINDTATYTYCIQEKNVSLLITVYYKNSETLNAIMSRIGTIAEDPDWNEDSYLLKEYEVITPEGFYIDPENCSDVCVNMLDKERDLYVFLYDDALLSEEKDADMSGSGDLAVVVKEEEELSSDLGDGIYLILDINQDGNTFRQHEYLIQAGSDVVKYMIMADTSGDDDERCHEVLEQALANTRFFGETMQTEGDESESFQDQ